MKVICVHDKVWDIYNNKYSNVKSKTVTKGKIYTVVKTQKIVGLLHYWIKNDKGSINYYCHSRFQKAIPNKIKVV